MLHHLQDLYSDQMKRLFWKTFLLKRKRNIINDILLALYNLALDLDLYNTVSVNAFINKKKFVWCIKKGQRHCISVSSPNLKPYSLSTI